MKQLREFIEAEAVILSPQEGGRSAPLSASAYQGYYRPHIVLESRDVRKARIETRGSQRHVTDEYLGVAFWSGPDPVPTAAAFTVTMLLMYAPHPAYVRVVPGTEFTIREGARIVGHGRVLRRWTNGDA